jgi:hypothetical protein
VKEGMQQEPKEIRYEGYQLGADKLLLYNNRLYFPSSTELRHMIMVEFFMRPYASHLGYQKMVTTVR